MNTAFTDATCAMRTAMTSQADAIPPDAPRRPHPVLRRKIRPRPGCPVAFDAGFDPRADVVSISPPPAWSNERIQAPPKTLGGWMRVDRGTGRATDARVASEKASTTNELLKHATETARRREILGCLCVLY